MPLDIVEFPSNDDKLNDIADYLIKTFEASIQSRSTQVEDKLQRWTNNYNAKPYEAVRTTPFYRAANFVPRLIGMHTDILHARTYGIIFGTKPFWKPRMLPEGPHEWLDALSDVMEQYTFNEMRLHVLLDSALMRAYKQGTVVVKAPWIQEEYYLGSSGEEKKISKEGIQPKCIPFDDFYAYPITANNLAECTIKYHRLRLTKEEVEYRIARGWWDKTAGQKLLSNPVSGVGGASNARGNATEAKATDAGINLSRDVDRPFTAVEAWFDYQLSPGKIYKLVATFNPFSQGKDALLRRFFNYYPHGEDPFIDLRPLPREDLFYGYSVPEILESSQEEQAQIHCSRRDASSIANVPGWKKKRYATVPNPSQEWYPGKVFELEDMGDLEPIQFNGAQYNSMIEEENFLLSLAERYTGAGQPMQALGAGILSGKRGIYNSGGTMAILAEGNRRLNIYLARLREGLHNLGNLIYQSHKAFRPEGMEYKVQGDRGDAITKTFQFSEPDGYSGLFFDIGASDAGANREIDRTSLLLMANTMASYYKQVVEISGVVGQIPPDNPLRQVMLSVLDGARDLANRLLFAFDVPDRKRLAPDVRAILGGGPGPQNSPGPGGPTGPGDMSATPSALSVGSLQELSSRLATISGGANGQNGNGKGYTPVPTGEGI